MRASGLFSNESAVGELSLIPKALEPVEKGLIAI
jgi:hypothetical protein